MPGNEAEQRIQVRAFSGVDIETDPAFLSSDTLQAAQNLIPSLTYLLQKRFGTDIWTNEVRSTDPLPWASPRIDDLYWALRTDGTPVLYFVVTTLGDGVATAKGDRLYAAVGNPVPTVTELVNYDTGAILMGPPVAGWVSTSGARYGMTMLGGRVYVGNGINPLVVVEVETNAVSTTAPIGSFSMANTAVLTVSTLATGLPTGTYSYRWGYLDSSVGTTSVWTSLGPTGTIVVTGSDPQSITFTGPTAGELSAATDPTLADLDIGHTVHLFLSPPGFPIEYARDHGMLDSTTGPPTLTVSTLVPDSELTPLRGTAFTGRYLQRHRGRIWLAGDQTNNLQNTSRLYSTNVIVPGLEQTLYNYGDFFPALASTQIGGFDGDVITGLAVSGGGQNKDVASAPMLIFKNSSLWAWFGDLVDDPEAGLVQISEKIGCVAPQTIVASSHEGVFFLGADSVYFLPTGFMAPIDIGLPIRPALEAIPKARVPFAAATFHRGFYKLAITPPGELLNTQQWWLDCRPVQYAADATAVLDRLKWWGPHACTAASAMVVAPLDPEEHERLYIGREVPPTEDPPVAIVCIADQKGLYTDTVSLGATTPVVSRLRTGGLVENEPFQWKDYTLIRIATLPDRNTPVSVTTYKDGGGGTKQPTMNQNTEIDGDPRNDLILTGGGGIWDRSQWDRAQWGSRTFVEGWSIIAPPIRARSVSFELTHADPSGILIRDLEVNYAPIERRAPGAR